MKTLVSCPLCGFAQPPEVVHRHEGYAIQLAGDLFVRDVTNVLCRACGLAYNNPMIDEVDIEEMYSTLCRRVDRGEDGSAAVRPPSRQDQESFAHLRRLFGRSFSGQRVLEVGCSYGSFLAQVAAEGAECHGIDLAGGDVEYARRAHGIRARQGRFRDGLYPEAGFDLVVLRFVFEHLPDPAESLRAIRRVLSRVGRLYLEVPDLRRPFDSLVDWFTLGHAYSYSSVTLGRMLERHGFHPASIETGAIAWEGHPLSCLRAIASPAVEGRETMAPDPEEVRISSAVLAAHRAAREHLRAFHRARFEELRRDWRSNARRVAIYGAGDHTLALFGQGILREGDAVCLLDGNPGLRRRRVFGLDVLSPHAISPSDLDVVVVSSPSSERSMIDTLLARGFADDAIVGFYGRADWRPPGGPR